MDTILFLATIHLIGFWIFGKTGKYIVQDDAAMSEKMENFIGVFVYLEVYGQQTKPKFDKEAKKLGLKIMLEKGEINQIVYDDLISKL